MKILTAKVVNGRLDVPEGTLNEGDTVTLLVPDSEGTLDLTPDERVLLREAMAELDRGEGTDGWRLLESLGRPKRLES